MAITNTQPQSSIKVDTKSQKVTLTKKQKCEGRGGVWDEATQTCHMPTKQPQGTKIEEQPQTLGEQQKRQEELLKIKEAELRRGEDIKKQRQQEELSKPMFSGQIDTTQQEIQRPQDKKEKVSDTIINFLPNGTIDYTRGGQTINLTREEYDVVKGKPGMVTDKVRQAKSLLSQEQLQAQELSSQLGQFERLSVEPTGLDIKEGLTTSLVSQLPKAITYGLGAAAVTGAGTNPVSIIAGVGTFLGTLTSGIISNFKSQRTDTTTAQQRVLDEGKQNLNDWVTMAAADPTRREFAINSFNKQLAQIDQAYRQMKLDTSLDVAKFETALPNLAEFEAFYNAQGERDFLIEDMRRALGGAISPETIDMRIMAMQNRLKK